MNLVINGKVWVLVIKGVGYYGFINVIRESNIWYVLVKWVV